MSKQYFFKSGNIVKFLSLFITVTLLSYCTTAPHETASSFSKRKYTKGHFSDPVAKSKTDYSKGANAFSINAIVPQNGVTGNTALSKPSHDAKNTLNGWGNAATYPKQTQPAVIAVAKSPVGFNNENVSLKDNSRGYPDHGYNDHDRQYDNHSSSSGLLIAWLVCLVVAIICFLIAFGIFAGGASGGLTLSSAEGGCFVYLLGYMAAIAALVLFILWIVAISKG